jgi:hypothetical protein
MANVHAQRVAFITAIIRHFRLCEEASMAATQSTQGDEQKKTYVPSEQISIDHGTSEVANPYAAALKLAAAHDGDDIDPLAEKKLVRKIDWFLMPLVISNARVSFRRKLTSCYPDVRNICTPILRQGHHRTRCHLWLEGGS